MRKVWIGSLLSLALLLASSFAFAHEGHVHTTLGTVVRVEKPQLEVKGADGNAVTFALTEKTAFRRGETSIFRADVKVGERVAVEFEEAGQARTAIRVTVGASQTATVYTCPMHPEVLSDKPGQCPKCGMTLELKAKKPTTK
jgi:Heavy metal binding domain